MTKDKENYLNLILDTIVRLSDSKYRAGDKEHGGDLRDLTAEQLVDNMIDEAIDQLIYALTLKYKLISPTLKKAEYREDLPKIIK